LVSKKVHTHNFYEWSKPITDNFFKDNICKIVPVLALSTTESNTEGIQPLLYVAVVITGIVLPTYVSLLEENQFIYNMTNPKKILHFKKKGM